MTLKKGYYATHTKSGKPVIVRPHEYRLDLVGKVLADFIEYELMETFHEIPEEEEDQFNIDDWWSDLKPFLIASLKANEGTKDLKVITNEEAQN